MSIGALGSSSAVCRILENNGRRQIEDHQERESLALSETSADLSLLMVQKLLSNDDKFSGDIGQLAQKQVKLIQCKQSLRSLGERLVAKGNEWSSRGTAVIHQADIAIRQALAFKRDNNEFFSSPDEEESAGRRRLQWGVSMRTQGNKLSGKGQQLIDQAIRVEALERQISNLIAFEALPQG